MSGIPLIEPEEWECPLPDGSTKTFLLGKFPAVAGREIIAKYPTSNAPKLGDYKVSEETMLKLMGHVAVPMADGSQLRLSTVALVNNHCADWETLARLEMKMLEKNCSFFKNGRALTFLQGIAQMAQALISKTLTDLSAQSSGAEKPPYTN